MRSFVKSVEQPCWDCLKEGKEVPGKPRRNLNNMVEADEVTRSVTGRKEVPEGAILCDGHTKRRRTVAGGGGEWVDEAAAAKFMRKRDGEGDEVGRELTELQSRLARVYRQR